MKFLFCVFIFCFLSTLSPTLSWADARRGKATPHENQERKLILLQVGESLNIRSPAFERVWLSRGGVVSVQDRGALLNIQARKEGELLLNAGNRLYFIQVLSNEKKLKLEAVNSFLSHRMGLKAHFVKDKIHVQGQLYRAQDFIDFSEKARNWDLSWLFFAKVPPALQKKLNAYIKYEISSKEANSHPLSPPTFVWQQPLVALVPSSDSKNPLYQARLKRFGAQIKKDPLLLPSPSLIKLTILIVESSADHSLQTHIDFGEKSLSRLLDGTIFTNLLSTFKSMENKGKARIFAKAELLTESGKKARFHSGGDVPIPYFNPETGAQSIKWKPYGIQLNFKATSDRRKKIRMETQMEISEVDHSYSAQSAPSIKAGRISSSLTMRAGQSLLLSKLIRHQSGKNRSAPVELFRLPLAGPLLSFKGTTKEQTRLSVFVTADLSD